MKTIIAAFVFYFTLCTASNAQNNLKLVPASASFIAKYAGENFTKNITVKKIDSYSFIKEDIFKILHLNKQSSLQNTGIDFGKDIYQYVFVQDTCMNFVSLLGLKNEAQFLKLIKANYSNTSVIIKKNGYNFLPVSNTTYISWNSNSIVIVNSNYQNRKSFYEFFQFQFDIIEFLKNFRETFTEFDNFEKH